MRLSRPLPAALAIVLAAWVCAATVAPAVRAAEAISDDCAAILARSSTAWAETCAVRRGGSIEALEDALARYGECYDAATDALSERVARRPGSAAADASGAPACLPELRAALEGFTEYALGAALSSGTYSRSATAYASLYEKQFRRLAWEAAAGAHPRPSPGGADPRLAAARSRLQESLDATSSRLRSDLLERFGRLQRSAERCGIAAQPLYEFAISLLQPAADPPFAPPPF